MAIGLPANAKPAPKRVPSAPHRNLFLILASANALPVSPSVSSLLTKPTSLSGVEAKNSMAPKDPAELPTLLETWRLIELLILKLWLVML